MPMDKGKLGGKPSASSSKSQQFISVPAYGTQPSGGSSVSPCPSCHHVAQAAAVQQCLGQQYYPDKRPGSGSLRSGFILGSPLSAASHDDNPSHSTSSGAESMSYTNSKVNPLTPTQQGVQQSSLPPSMKVKLYELFGQIEKEFEILYSENMSLHERIESLTNAQTPNNNVLSGSVSTSTITSDINARSQPSDYYKHTCQFANDIHHLANVIDGRGSQQAQQPNQNYQPQGVVNPSQQRNTVAPGVVVTSNKSSRVHKLRTHTNRLRQQTTRIMSNFSKGPSGGSSMNCTPLRRYMGHKDGVWEVASSKMGLPIIGTASADHTAVIWGMHSSQALLQYVGHTGSVNSLRFHPLKELVLTASGDGSVHIWQCAVHLHNESSSGRMASSEDELDPFEKENNVNLQNQFHAVDTSEMMDECSVLRTPLRSLTGHQGVVIAADWLPGGDQAVTAGWDRLACIWDTQTGQLLHQLAGHDDELTHTATHPSQRLVVTSSKDSTFRLWDFRESIHSVSVFQGHQDTVTSAVFSRDEDKIISGSDDRSARIWDLRNMRSPVATIQSDSAVNRLSVCSSFMPASGSSNSGGLIAIPFDNRNVRLYDMNGQRVGRLPRSSRQQGHSRMVCCTAWSEYIEDAKPNLFTCGFDRMTLGWSIQPRHEALGSKDTESTYSAVTMAGSTVSDRTGGGGQTIPGGIASSSTSAGHGVIMGSAQDKR